MKKYLFILLFIFTIFFSLKGFTQTNNQISGATITPSENLNSHTPRPYDGTLTFNPGSLINTGDWNLVIGPGAGASLTSSYNNILLGGMAGAKFEASSRTRNNTVIGVFTADQTTSGFENVYIGNMVARFATGSDNVVVGHSAGRSLTSGVDNTLIGEEAGENLTTGSDNVFVGEDAGHATTTANDNLFVGSRAGVQNRTGSGNTFVGGESSSLVKNRIEGFNIIYSISTVSNSVGHDNTTGEGNTFIGNGAGQDNTDGYANTYLGFDSGGNSNHSNGNTFVGYGAGWDNNRTNDRNIANRNTYVGAMAGGTNRNGSDNIGLGWNANYTGTGSFGSSNSKNNRNIFLGNSVRVFGDDQVIIGHGAMSSGNKGSITIGALSSTTKSYAAAIGYNVDVTEANTMALGGNELTNRFSVGIGTLSANQNASLELADTDKGFLINRLTTAQRIAMETAAASGNALTVTDAGLMVYDTDLTTLFVWNGTAWVSTTSLNTDNQKIDSFQLTGNKLELSIEEDNEEVKEIDLSKYLDNTDKQRIDTLMLGRNKIMISLENDNEKFKELDLSWFLQTLSLSSNELSISGHATSIDLSNYLDNTDNQDLSLTDNTLSLSNDASSVDLSKYLDNTDSQTISLVGTDLSIANGNTIDVSVLQDGIGTDNQDLDLSNNTLSLTNDGTSVDLSGYLDNTDSQTISLIGTDLSITNGNTIDVSTLQDGIGTDNQDLDLSNNTLSLSNDATSVDLSRYLDNTDAQTISLIGTDLSITNGNTIDISVLQDGTGTDNQDLDLSNNTLSLSNDASSIDLSKYLDNTDTQTISLIGTDLTITNGNTIDISSLQDGTGTDNQDLDLSNNTLSLTNDGTSVDLSGYLDNTDTQTISLSGTNLTIANGNTIDVSSLQDGTGTDSQNLTSAALSGNDLIISIENGDSVSVDLSPILSGLKNDLFDAQTEISELKTQMTSILSRLEKLEACSCNNNPKTAAILYQNIPNPFNNNASIKHNLIFPK